MLSPWSSSSRPGREGQLKAVRARARTLGVASSFVVQGGLTDYHGAVRLHQAGINVKGSTHDAIAYEQTVLASRLEGPVLYPPAGEITGVHAGSRYGDFKNRLYT